MRKRLSPGALLGVIAVVIAMSGSAYAAAKITGKQIKDGTVTSADIKNRSLTTADMSTSAMHALTGQSGPAGSQGPAGPVGPAGPAGPSAVSKLTPSSLEFSVPGGSDSSTSIDIVTVTCPAGQRVISGGYFMDSGVAFADKTYDGASWSIGVDNFGAPDAATVDVTALCSASGVAVAASVPGHARRDAKITRDLRRYRAAKNLR